MNSQNFVTPAFYFPSISWFAQAWASEQVVIPNLHYRKEWKLNKMTIVGADGPLYLSIPIEGGRSNRLPLNEIKMSMDTPWQRHHLRSIETCYRKAPFFEHFYPSLEQLYTQSGNGFEAFTLSTIKWCVQYSGVLLPIVSSDEPLQNEAFPTVELQYTQVFAQEQAFVNDCSLLDLLFCEGRAGIAQLRNIKKM
jgi:hypothetical protein